VHTRLSILASPLGTLPVHRCLRVSWVVLHIVVRCVGRVLLLVRVGRARLGGNRWIYRYIVVRLELLGLLMVIGLTI
jgi:hypothetical protein